MRRKFEKPDTTSLGTCFVAVSGNISDFGMCLGEQSQMDTEIHAHPVSTNEVVMK